MKKLIIFLNALHKNAYLKCSRKGRRPYLLATVAWVIACAFGFITGADVAFNFGFSTPGIIIGGLLSSLVVGAFDFFLLGQVEKSSLANFVRLVTSLAVAMMGSVFAMFFLFHQDIHSVVSTNLTVQLTMLDSTYQDAKTIRFQELETSKKQTAEYHLKNCHREGLNVYKGPEYRKIHAFCIQDSIKQDKLEAKLQEAEATFNSIYLSERNSIISKGLGIGKKASILVGIFKKDKFNLFLGIVLFVILLALDTLCILAKINISKDDEYHRFERKFLEAEERIKMTLLKEELEIFEKEMLTKVRLQNVVATQKWIPIKAGFSKMISAYNKVSEQVKDSLRANVISNSDNKENEVKSSVSHLQNPSIATIFYMTMPMKALADKLWRKANESPYVYAQLCYEWMDANISYNSNHTKEYYSTAREIFNVRLGICGEMTILYIAFLRYKSLQAKYAHVDVDHAGKSVNHACAYLEFSTPQLVDIAYHSFNINHQKWTITSDDNLVANMKSWNK